ncbi:MAG TPA: MYXO-CTERM sorting domain-containing protein, partial [Kofleriaceae bacterium]|nr:MYXO-CTERM sorting domain-containing protein [Kofleriaceae bacterium]
AAPYAIKIPDEVPDGTIDVVVVAKDDIGATTTAPAVRVQKGVKCVDASTCLPGMECDAEGRCFWQPASGAIGDVCTYPQFCESGICTGPSGNGDKLCTQNCVPNVADSCPAGFECLQTGATTGACWPASDDGGGCCSTTRGAAAQSALLALGLVLVLRRRRRAAVR